MEVKIEKIKPARVKFIVKATATDLNGIAEHVLEHFTSDVAVKGFRPGKAPKPMLVQAVGKGRLLSELVDHALPDLLQEATNDHKFVLIETPAYTLEKLCELKDDGSLADNTTLEFTAEADYAPEVEVGDYRKIKVKPAKIEEVTDKTIDEVLQQLAERRAAFSKVDRGAKKNDRVEIDFTELTWPGRVG